MRSVFVVLAALALCIAANGAYAMTYEVDALYAEEAYEPFFIEVNSMEEQPAFLESEAELEAEPGFIEAEAETETDAEVDADTEADTEAEADTEVDADADLEDFVFVEGTPAATTTAANATAANATVANATTPAINTTNANVTLVNATANGFPTVPNPADRCGCYNGAACQVNVCMCPSQWAGQWCERPSPIALARQTELERLANLTSVIQRVGKQVSDIEAASGSPQAVQRLIAEAARKEIIAVNIANAEREFHKALSNNDMFVAREQLNLIKHMDNEKYPILLREFHVQEERIAKALGAAAPGIKVMEVPAMQEDKYKDVDVTFAKELRAATFERANKLVEDAKAQGRQFNLDFGDPV